MTFLEAVNRVLIRLREEQVAVYDATTYSTLIGQLVNEAKREVEDAHAWQELRTLIDASIIANDTSVSFAGTSRRTRVIEMYNDTTDQRLLKKSREWIVRQREYQITTGEPGWWAFAGYTSGNVTFEVWPTSDGSYTLTLDCVNPQPALASNSTEIQIPEDPVVLRATALALAERGDDQGQSFAQLMNEYQIALNDAVTRDIDLGESYPDNNAWYVPCR